MSTTGSARGQAASRDASSTGVSYPQAFDLTEKKILEASLLQAQKMEAIGRLAGGVSHDFNTLLGTITGYAELLLDGLSGDGTDLSPDQARMWIERIHRAARRGAVLTRQLLAFSRQQALRPRRVDLGAVTSETADMIRRLIGEDIAFECAFDECLGAVCMDSGQLQQVLLNLAVNAADAMPTGGRLAMSWSRQDLETTTAMAGGSIAPGSYAQLEVMDSGIGMDEETLVRIFEPFFTTKEIGKGTGLGLSTVFGIVQQWNGGIQVSSRPGAGTIFKIFFPEVAPSHDESSDTIERPLREECKSQLTILLVEDDTQFRELVGEVLTSKGYTVIEAGSPLEAESLGDEVLARVEVLVSDMVMPNGTGVELARSMRSRIPGLRVILMSGYGDEDLKSRELGESTADAFLEKPFGVRELHDAIGRASARAD